MRLSRTWMGTSERAKRLALMGLAAGIFVLAARTLGPFGSAAATRSQPGNGRPIVGSDPAPVVPGRQLGELQGQEFRLLVLASPLGPRYTVISPDGVVLAENLSDEDVAREFPGLEIETMTADAPSDALPGLPDW